MAHTPMGRALIGATRLTVLDRALQADQLTASAKRGTVGIGGGLITAFNIEARYPDLKRSCRERCTAEFTARQMKAIEEVFE